MAKKRLTVRDKLQKLQQATFVGRQEQIISFQENLKRGSEDLHFANIINVFGQGGVGKTTLLRKFEEYARQHKALVVYTDEAIKGVPEYMAAVADQMARLEKPLKKFSDRFRVYRQKKQELELDPQAPTGLAGLLGRTLAKGSVELAKGVPGGKMILEHFDTDGLANQAGEWASFVAKKLTNKDEVQLILEPEKVLTPIWLSDLGEIAEKHQLYLFIDTYEETSKFLDGWLRELLDNRHGDFDPNIILTIAGRHRLDPNGWSVFNPISISMPVEPFLKKEAASFLDHRGIIDSKLRETIIRLSGCIPVLMATLAEASPKSAGDLSDVSNLAVERFLKWVSDPEKREIALHATVPTHINLDIIKQLVTSENADILFDWLQSMPFIQKRANQWTYHPVVRAQMLYYLRLRSMDNWAALHRKLTVYFEKKRDGLKLEKKDAFRNDNWIQYALQALYHHLCENYQLSLPLAINGFLNALEEKRSFATQWAETINLAEKDLKLEEGICWGTDLAIGLKNYEKDDYQLIEKGLEKILKLKFIEEKNKSVLLAWRAKIHWLDKKYDDALSGFTQAIEIRPDYEWAIAQRGSLYQEMKRYEEALVDYNKAIELKPDDEWNFAQRGSLYQDMKCYEEALVDYNKAIDLKSDYEWAIAQRGSLYQEMKCYDEALVDYNKAIELKPDDEWNFAHRGSLYQGMKRYDEALVDLNKAIEIRADYEWTIAHRGSLYQQMKRYDEALVDLNKAIEIRADYYEWAIVNRGFLYQEMKRYDEALIDYNKAIEIRADYYEWAIAQRGSLYQDMERYDEALIDYNKAIELKPDYEWAIAQRGSLYQDMKRYDKALVDYNKAIELKPDYELAIAQRGSVYQDMKRYDEALVDYNKAIELKPDYEWAIAQRGSLYQDMKRYDKALVDLNKAIELKPDDEWNFAHRGKTYLLLKDWPKAKINLQQSLEIDPESGWSNYLYFLVSQKIGKTEEGKKALQRAKSIAEKTQQEQPRDLQNQFNLSLYYLSEGNKDRALEIAKKALAEKATFYHLEEFVDDLVLHLEVLPDASFIKEMLAWGQEELKNMKKNQ